MYNESLKPKQFSGWLLALIMALSVILSGCSGTNVAGQETAAEEVSVEGKGTGGVAETKNATVQSEADPYENINRKVYVFNEKVDTYVAKPISDAYLWITPQFVQTGIANFFSNLKDINVVLNDVMQGKLQQGLADTGRFTVNSTVGLLGVFDVASDMGLEKHDEDFDQTLAVWGVPEGPYLVLPLLGPTTSRGIPGSVFDTAANPTTYVGLPVQLVSMLNSRANAEGALKFIDEAALDPYIFTRESFLQYRRNLATDGQTEIYEDTLDLEDELYDEDEDGSSNSDSSVKLKEEAKDDSQDKTQQPAAAKGHSLKLSAEDDRGGFEEAAGSFDNAVKSLDKASHSFEQADEKLDRMEAK